MARRPAYNTKAEIARRVAARARLVEEFAALQDDAEPLVPVISSFVQYHRRLNEYLALKGEKFDRYRDDFPPESAVAEARERWEIAFSLSYLAAQTAEFIRAISDGAAGVALAAGGILQSLQPYTEEELDKLRVLYPEG